MSKRITSAILASVVLLCLVCSCRTKQNTRRAMEFARDYAAAAHGDSVWVNRFDSLLSLQHVPDSTLCSNLFRFARTTALKGNQNQVLEFLIDLTDAYGEGDGSHESDFFLSRLYLMAGNCAFEMNMTNLSLDYYLPGLELARRTGDKMLEAQYLNNLGIQYGSIRNFEKSDFYLKQAEKLNKEYGTKRQLFFNYNNLAETETLRGHTQKALDYMLEAIQCIDKEKDADIYYFGQSNIGHLYHLLGEDELALTFARNALSQLLTDANLYEWVESCLQLANIYQDLGMTDSASYYLDKARHEGLSIQNPAVTAEIYELASALSQSRGDVESSLEDLRHANLIRDSLQQAEDVHRMQVSEQIYTLSPRQTGEGHTSAWWYIAAFTVGVCVTLATRSILKKKKSVTVAVREDATPSRHIYYEDALKERDRQLTFLTMEKVRDGESAEEIASGLRSVLKEIPLRHKEIRTSLEKSLSKLDSLSSADRWDELRLCIEKTSPDFYSKLLELCPDLTGKDQRLCALLYLGLETKEIATVTHREIRSVESSRTRLRKKLGLDTQQSLTDFLRTLA